MSLTLVDPRMFNTAQALGAHDGSALTSLPANGWEFVSSQTASASSTIDFTGFAAGYDYKILGYDIRPGTDAQNFRGRVGTGATPTYQTTGYAYSTIRQLSGSAGGSSGSTDTFFDISGNNSSGNAAGEFGLVEVDVLNPADTGAYTHHFWRFMSRQNAAGAGQNMTGGGYRTTDEATTAFRLYFASGTISQGEFFLFRRANT